MARSKLPQIHRQFAADLLQVAIDTGGTFTDAIWVQDGQIRVLKVLSTPPDPSRAILQALRQILAGLDQAPTGLLLLHGTTVGTNTVLERKGARVAFVTTAGFEDSMEIGRQARPRLYDLFFDRVAPLVPEDLRFGVAERTAADGTVLQVPGNSDLKSLREAVAARKPGAIAISFLFSFVQPGNEIRAGRALEHLGLPISISHQILPEFREYERASTVVMNAYLQPVMGHYLGMLETGVKNLLRSGRPRRAKTREAARVFLMQSSGGITSLQSARNEPVRTLLSGPAGGVVGALASARRSGWERIIAFDMGGTSTDVTLSESEPKPGNEGEIAGLPVRVPMLDIHTIGAGGGSISRFDSAGALRVGPESAGADPGPICYGRGTQPTVTDANLLLGRVPNRFLGGDFPLYRERTEQTIRAWLRKERSGMSLTEFAAGVVRVVNAAMEKAVRVVSVERGYDPRDFALVAFGGAGGMHACELAAALEIPYVIVPAMPGALSALGILVSDIVKDYSRTVMLRLESADKARGQWLRLLEEERSRLVRKARRDFQSEHGALPDSLDAMIDVRYRGQGYEINVPFQKDFLNAFHNAHHQRYGYSHPEREVEVVTLRLRARLASRFKREPPKSQPVSSQGKPVASRAIFGGRSQRVLLYERDLLPAGKRLAGPAIVNEYSATTVVPPGMRFWLDRAENLVIKTSGHSGR